MQEAVASSGLRLDLQAQNSLWQHMFKKSTVRLGTREEFRNRKSHLAEIEGRIDEGRFVPELHGFLSSSKGFGVARFVPVLTAESCAVYFACVRALDEHCAELAVDGTFGGWSLGGKRRDSEEKAIRALLVDPGEASLHGPATSPAPIARLDPIFVETNSDGADSVGEDDVDAEISTPVSPYNKHAWVDNWQEFWKVLAATEERLGADTYFVTFDIANYYDSIDLVILKDALSRRISHSGAVLDVLFDFLGHWNRKMRLYKPSSKGIPMDIVGDMSRVLANFNLIGLDTFMKESVESQDGRYIRWADDITFTSSSRERASALLYAASSKLHEMGLNVNAAKVRIYSKGEFRFAWGFEIMDLLLQPDKLDNGLTLLKERWDSNFERRETVIRRAIGLLRERPDLNVWRKWAYDKVTELTDFPFRFSHGQLQSLITISDNPEQAGPEISSRIMESPFTEPKTQLLRCFERQRNNRDAVYGNLYGLVKKELLRSGDRVLVLAAENSV